MAEEEELDVKLVLDFSAENAAASVIASVADHKTSVGWVAAEMKAVGPADAGAAVVVPPVGLRDAADMVVGPDSVEEHVDRSVMAGGAAADVHLDGTAGPDDGGLVHQKP